MTLNWSRFETGKIGPEKAFEAFVAQLFERWLRREYGEDLVSYVLYGAGGDGGVEAFARLPCGNVVGLQAKWFAGNITAAEITKIRKSLNRALKSHPNLSRYVLALRQNLTKGRNQKEKGGVERWEEFIGTIKTKHPRVELIRWDDAGLRNQLTCPGNQEVKALWFEGELTLDLLQTAWDKARFRLDARYLPDLHSVGLIDATLDGDLWRPAHMARALADLTTSEQSLAQAASNLDGFAQLTKGRCPNDLDEAVSATVETLAALRAHARMLRDVLTTGPRVLVRELPTVDALQRLKRTIEEFAKPNANIFTGEMAGRAVTFASSALETLRQIDRFLRESARPRIMVGPPGCGKTHAAAAAVDRRIQASHPAVFVLAKASNPANGAGRVLADVLDTPGWSLRQMLDGLEALATLHQVSLTRDELEPRGFSRCLLLIDGLEESPKSAEWTGVLSDLAVELRKRPRLHLVAMARAEYIRSVKVPDGMGQTLIDDERHVDLPAMLTAYAREFSVSLEEVPWLGWVLRTPLEVRLLAEEYQRQVVSASVGATTNLLTLFRRKLARLETEAWQRAGANAWTADLKLATTVLNSLSDITLESDSPYVCGHDLIRKMGEIDSEFTAQRVRLALSVLHDYGLVDCWRPPAHGLGEPLPEYSLTTRHLSDFVLGWAMAERTLASIQRGNFLVFPEVLRFRDAATAIFASILAEHGHFLIDLTWREPPPDLRMIQIESFAWISSEISATRSKEIAGWLVESTAMNRAILRKLVIPVSRIPGHPLGPHILDSALRTLPLAQRDPIWSVPDDLDGNGSWCGSYDFILDEFELSAAADTWEGLPLLAAWTTSSVVEHRRQRAREMLAVWGAERLGDMVCLLAHMADVDDPQVLDDCVVAALGAASGAPVDDCALRDLAHLMDELFFADQARSWTESIPVRVAARGVIERAALVYSGEFVDILARARPPYPPRGDWPGIDAREVAEDGHMGGVIVSRDLDWYVANGCFGDFLETASPNSGFQGEPIDSALLKAIAEGRLDAPRALAKRLAAAQKKEAARSKESEIALKKLLETFRIWHRERAEGNTDQMDQNQLVQWALTQPEMRRPPDERNPRDSEYSEEFKQLLTRAARATGISAPTPHAVRNGMIAHLVKAWGWSSEAFARHAWDKPPEVVDDAIAKRHGPGATHGSRSTVCSFREKYVWAAVDRVAGALADRLPVWSRKDDAWVSLSSLDRLGNGMPDPLPRSAGHHGAVPDSSGVWAPEGVLDNQFRFENSLAVRAELWLTKGALPDPLTLVRGEAEDWSDAAVLAFSHYRRGHQCCIDQLVQVAAYGIKPEDVELLRRDAKFVIREEFRGGAGVIDTAYVSPAIACWAPWMTWECEDQGYDSFSEHGEPRHVELRSMIGRGTASFRDRWPHEPDVWMPSPSLARLLGVAGMQGHRWRRSYVDRQGGALAVERDVPPPFICFDHHYLVTAMTPYVHALKIGGFEPVWVVRTLREATPALHLRADNFDPPPGLKHRSRDVVWVVIGDPRREPVVLIARNSFEPWDSSNKPSENGLPEFP